RLRIVVPGEDLGAAEPQGLRASGARACETEDRDFLVGECAGGKHPLAAYLSLRVERPISARTKAMIQKRMTMVGSFHPFCSKWWCRGAMAKTRLPVSLKDAA